MKQRVVFILAAIAIVTLFVAPLLDPAIRGISAGYKLFAFFDGTITMQGPSLELYTGFLSQLITSPEARWSLLVTFAIVIVGILSVVLYIALQEGSQKQQNKDLGDSRIIKSIGEIRRKNDFWNGKKTPKRAGLVLGSTKKGYIYESSTPHCLVAGKTGSGKTQLMVLETAHLCMAAGWNLIVTGKNEVLELTANKANELGYKILHLDLTGYPGSMCFNPIDIVTDYYERGDNGKAVKAAREVALAILPVVKSESNPYFSNAARSALTAVILAVCMSPEATREQKNLASVAALIITGTGGDSSDPAARLRGYFEKLGADHPAYLAAHDFLSDGGKTTAGKNVCTNLQLAVGIYLDETVRNITSRSTFAFEDIIQQSTVVYLGLPEEGDPYMPVYACFFQQYWQKAREYAASNGGRLPHETAIIADEFGNLPKLDCIPEIATLGRSYRLHEYLFVQNLKQLNKYDAIGDNGAGHEKILGSIGIQVALSLGTTEDARHFSELCGKTTANTFSNSTQTGRGSSTSSSHGTSQTSVDLIKEWEWMQRTPIRDGSIVIKGAENSRPGHEGVFRMPLRYANQTIARDFFDLGDEEYEFKKKQQFYAERRRLSSYMVNQASIWVPDMRTRKEKSHDEWVARRANDELSVWDD